MTIQVICAWCQRWLYNKPSNHDTLRVSHGICPECQRGLKREAEECLAKLNASDHSNERSKNNE